MTELYVDPEALRKFGRSIDGYADDAGTAKTYHGTWCTLTGGHGIFQNFTSLAAEVRIAVDDALDHMQEVLRSSGAELESSADYYAETDDDVAAEMDGKYPR
ncbi:type VII secretion target [Pseudactinotalea sp. Z1748]|uniref:type VII secretion target n=1 Tax=Pseudactinotalea sp. Z1748 TaxID=3413027 RepID=UPI003C7CE3CA